MADPLASVKLLDRLVGLGFSDEHFAVVHHFEGEPIERHRKYCAEHTGKLQSGGTNERVQMRLRLILSAYLLGGFTKSAAFTGLSRAAVAEIPL